MKNILKNKRFMFPIIMCLIVIFIAIVVFIIIGLDTDKERVSEIKLDNVTVNNNQNVINTDNAVDDEKKDEDEEEKKNTAKNTVKPDDEQEEIDFDGETFYLETAQDFVRALTDKDDMASFIDNHVDAKAYIACYNTNGDDAKFMDEYMSIEVDDDEINDLIEKFQDIAVESDAKLTALTDPRQSSDNDVINRVTLSIKTDSDSRKIRMVFYKNIVIYIYDDNGDSIVDID